MGKVSPPTHISVITRQRRAHTAQNIFLFVFVGWAVCSAIPYIWHATELSVGDPEQEMNLGYWQACTGSPVVPSEEQNDLVLSKGCGVIDGKCLVQVEAGNFRVVQSDDACTSFTVTRGLVLLAGASLLVLCIISCCTNNWLTLRAVIAGEGFACCLTVVYYNNALIQDGLRGDTKLYYAHWALFVVTIIYFLGFLVHVSAFTKVDIRDLPPRGSV